MKYLLFFFFSTLTFGQQIAKVDFIKCDAELVPVFETKSISGKVTYLFKVKEKIDTIAIDAKNMTFYDVIINGKLVKNKATDKKLLL